jgi:hypothetical protein
MTVRRHWTAQDAWVFHSEWWLREHWGRLFDVCAVARPPRTDAGAPQVTHSYVALTRPDVALTKDELLAGPARSLRRRTHAWRRRR